jgi:hypothetical protein
LNFWQRILKFAKWWRVVGLTLALGVALTLLVSTMQRHYPLQHWLILRYALYWLASLLFVGSTAVFGSAMLRWIWGGVLPIREHWAMALPLGLIGYFLSCFLVGVTGLLGTWFFFAAPVAMLAIGALPTFRYTRRLRRGLSRARRIPAERKVFPLTRFLWALGVGALALIYFSILHPDNTGYDARWYHLVLAEHYASAGAVERFPEGWVMGTYPQLGSLVYTWAFLAPGARLFDRVELSAHLEFVIFVWRVLSLPVLVQRLLPRGGRAPASWAAHFLFPGVFLYDSSLLIGADHLLGLFAVPIFLMLLRAWPALSSRPMLLLGAMLAGAFLVKYTSVLLLAFPALAVALRLLWLLVRPGLGRSRSGALVGSAWLAGSGLLLTAPHWLKNWFWYGDPLYPQLHTRLSLRPWMAEANIPYHHDIAVAWHATRDWAGILDTLRVTATFAFEHHDWPDLHGRAPVFGFLFTLTALCLPFLGKAWRLWALYFAGHLGVVAFCTVSWQDRYLQALVPWMASATAASLILAFRTHWLTRILAVALVTLQVAWGSDVYFYTTHRMAHSPLQASIRLINTGREGNHRERFRVFSPLSDVAKGLPKSARPLIHESRQTLGLGRPRVHDRAGTQGALYYSSMRSPRALQSRLLDFRVTHLVWTSPEGIDTLASDLVFLDFATNHTKRAKTVGPFQVAELSRTPVSATPFGKTVGVFDCSNTYEPGVYQLSDLTVSPFDPARPYPKPRKDAASEPVTAIAARADYLVINAGCAGLTRPTDLRGFKEIGARLNTRLYARKR